MDKHINALRTAFPYTIPILAGFSFIGIAYGMYVHALGFEPIYTFIMSFFIFAGSMEFVAATLLLGEFNPIYVLFLTLMLNGRHLFYGISMLERFKGTGKKKFYLIYGMCDESFVINSTATIPSNVDRGWFMFYVTLLNMFYWVSGAMIGSFIASIVSFDTKGLDFVMTALFVVIFLDQWMREDKHYSSLIGIGVSVLALIIFGPEYFTIPAMIIMLVILTPLRGHIENKKVVNER
ncbi:MULTISPECIES: AzlC family ABC transporter permease [Bacillaceae]|uniref:AzlC family ABC transporter permease n=1 Tax=Bacillaceae TaxID=186817 RepID=UPI00119EFEC0|nr:MULTISPECIES: AzlC family ABC transporter permease [Bacillaceae]MBU8791537.1 AzlC family ABC transporter permease [Oceanobacillus caeni]